MLIDPPPGDTLEISLFGPGKGECIAVHLKDGRWIIVDSCIDQPTARVPVLDYFQNIGVDPATQVEFVIGTHAHDDHIAGISKVFDACKAAHFVCPFALSKPEFLALVGSDKRDGDAGGRVREEFDRVFDMVEQRKVQTQLPIHYASPGRPLLDEVDVSVVALSPSDSSMSRALQAMAEYLKELKATRTRKYIEPNELSVALKIRVGNAVVILGSDLESGPTGCGWEWVATSTNHVTKASLYKVAHHGSVNAHSANMWSSLLAPMPYAILTPFRSSSLPRQSDIDRIVALTSGAYITASVKAPKPSAQVKRAAKNLQSIASNVRVPWGKAGHIRARLNAGAPDWDFSLVAPALRLT